MIKKIFKRNLKLCRNKTEQAGGSCIHAKYTCFSLNGYHGLTPVSNQAHTATHSLLTSRIGENSGRVKGRKLMS